MKIIFLLLILLSCSCIPSRKDDSKTEETPIELEEESDEESDEEDSTEMMYASEQLTFGDIQ